MENFNKLTPAELERLAILAEECGEVIQIIGKIQRHGYESKHPDGGDCNGELLEQEVGDLICAINLMISNDDLRPSEIRLGAEEKANRIRKYLHHNDLTKTERGDGQFR